MASGLGSGSAEGSGSGSASAPSCVCFCIANSSAVVGVPFLCPLSSRLQSAPALINCGVYVVYEHGMYTAASAAVCVVCATQPGAAHQPDEVVVPEVAGDHERRRRIREGRGAVDVCAPFKQDVSSSELVVKASVAQWRGVLMVEPVEPGARGEQQLHDPHVSASVQRRPAHPKEALRRGPGGRAAAWWACCCLVGVLLLGGRSSWESHLPLDITHST